jgi:protein TonB
VTLKLVVDASGNVKSVTVMKGLGHGLDQAAAAAAKSMKFTPGTRCGRPAEAPFIIAVRFALGE